jgi:hypothetical protein
MVGVTKTLIYGLMEQCALKNINNCLNANIYFYLDTFGSQSSNLHLNVVHFVNTSVNKTSVEA